MKRLSVLLSVIGVAVVSYCMAGTAAAQSTLDPALAFALSSSGPISLGLNSSINGGSIGALGNLTVGARTRVSNEADTAGKLRLGGFATVSGACASPTQPKIPHSASCLTTQIGLSTPGVMLVSLISNPGVSYCPATGSSNSAIDLKRNQTASISVGSPVSSLPTVFDYPSIKLGNGTTLTITGPSDGLAVINIAGILKLGVNATITNSGGLPVSNILIIADKVQLARRATISATIFTAGACSLGVNSIINGQMYCKSRVTMSKNGKVNENPLNQTVAMGVTCPAAQ